MKETTKIKDPNDNNKLYNLHEYDTNVIVYTGWIRNVAFRLGKKALPLKYKSGLSILDLKPSGERCYTKARDGKKYYITEVK